MGPPYLVPYFFSLCHAIADPLHGQLTLHLGHGPIDGLYELKHLIAFAGVEVFLDEVNSYPFVFKILHNLPQIIDVADRTGNALYVNMVSLAELDP